MANNIAVSITADTAGLQGGGGNLGVPVSGRDGLAPQRRLDVDQAALDHVEQPLEHADRQ
jgi:hypothetical protein